MQNKDSFVLYTKYIEIFKELTDEQAGKLIKVILEYVNDLNPEPEGLIKIANRSGITFEQIKKLNPEIKAPMYLVRLGQKVRIK